MIFVVAAPLGASGVAFRFVSLLFVLMPAVDEVMRGLWVWG